MHVSRTTRWKLRLNSLLFLALFLLAIGLLAWLSHQYRYVQDWTANHRNSLAPTTVKLLRANPRPYQFIAFVANNADLHARVRRQIALYQAVDPHISLKFVNPDLHPAQANRYGVTHTGQLAIALDGRTRVVENLSQETLLNALLHLTRGADQWVVFLDGHQERSPFDTTSAGLSRLAAALQHDGFHLQPLNLLRTPQIPENTSVLVIAEPKTALTAGEVTAIGKYLAGGGALLWLHAPGSLHGLDPLAKQLGIRFVPGTVVDADANLRTMLGIKNPAIVPILNYGPSPVTEHLQIQTLIPFSAGIVQPAGNAHWSAVPLLRTLQQSWSTTAPLHGTVHFDAARGDTAGPLILGEALTGKSVHGGKQPRAVILGSGAFASNAFIGQGANLELALAAINWLGHDDSLIQVHLPAAPDTRLQLSRVDGYVIAGLFLVALPLALFITGGVIWLRRRRPAR
ncbi:GldG family protein [Acidihalobacter ferrooxydans]|uniref:ABC-type uncharacterized transport system domain-containing protein n=1 Tax=Acidihalobacter ferrooxydans TaxID=1765967 RepID=A0A1P8UE34_9GAMM|nr:Gldg family protein [Acidihalobacter ferrooxydans]APZ42066.1 hypothetical protein BW247_02270 [Acidihalobacter ferrooxydans]